MDRTDDDARATLDCLLREQRVSYGTLSRLIGRNAAYVQQYVKRGSPRRLEDNDRRTIARFLGVDDAVLRGRDSAPPVIRPSDTIAVPRLALGASAGGGSLAEGEQPVGRIAFDSRWLRDLGRDPSHLSIIGVDGDSMAPTLDHGDDIMVDRDDGLARLRDGIYVIRFDDTLMVKRIALSPQRGHVSIRSDNAAYPSWGEVALADIRVIGRVVWVGRRLR